MASPEDVGAATSMTHRCQPLRDEVWEATSSHPTDAFFNRLPGYRNHPQRVFCVPAYRVRFQIIRLFPGYRNHFSQGGMEPLDLELCTRSGRGSSHRILRGKPQHNRFYLFS